VKLGQNKSLKKITFLLLGTLVLINFQFCVSVPANDDNAETKEEDLWSVQDYDPEYNEKNKKKSTWDWLF